MVASSRSICSQPQDKNLQLHKRYVSLGRRRWSSHQLSTFERPRLSPERNFGFLLRCHCMDCHADSRGMCSRIHYYRGSYTDRRLCRWLRVLAYNIDFTRPTCFRPASQAPGNSTHSRSTLRLLLTAISHTSSALSSIPGAPHTTHSRPCFAPRTPHSPFCFSSPSMVLQIISKSSYFNTLP